MCKVKYSLNVHDFLIIFLLEVRFLITASHTICNNEQKMLWRQSSFQQLQFDYYLKLLCKKNFSSATCLSTLDTVKISYSDMVLLWKLAHFNMPNLL